MRYFFKSGEYMGMEGSCKFDDYKDDLHAVLSEIFSDDPDEDEVRDFANEMGFAWPLKEKEVIEYYESINGDGAHYVTIANITEEYVVVGELY